MRNVQRVHDGEVEDDHRSLHEDRAAEAAGERARALAEAGERRRQLLDSVADPFGMERRVSGWSSRPKPAARARPARTRPRPAKKPAQSHAGQIGSAAWRRAAGRERRAAARPPARAPSARARDRPARPSSPASSIRAARAVSRIRMTSPPMLLGRKLLKKIATRNEPSSRSGGNVHVLRVEQQMPAPGAGRDVDRCTRRARRRSQGSDAVRALAHSLRDVDAREEDASSATLTASLSAMSA